MFAQDPLKSMLQVMLIQLPKHTCNQLSIGVEESSRRNRFSQLQFLHLFGGGAHQQGKGDFGLFREGIDAGLGCRVVD